MKNGKFMCDFETTTNPDDCRVWAAAWCDMSDYTYQIYNNLDDFMTYFLGNQCTLYFHNLKFDGEFIIYWLYKNGFVFNINSKELKDNEFSCLIADTGQFYLMTIQYKNKQIKIIDSFKILVTKVEKLPKMFGLDYEKLEIDYDEEREPGHILTKQEKDYIITDVIIVAKALNFLFNEGLIKITQGSNALADYKKMMNKRWNYLYPILECDSYIRKSYKGGFTFLNPKFAGKEITNGIVLDVNSLYPYVMKSRNLPYGEPKYFKGKYEEDRIYNVYVCHIRCSFEVKEDHIPTIQIKHSIYFIENQYLNDSDGEIVDLFLTSVDLKLFLDHYYVYNLEYIDGYKFRSSDQMFCEYVSKWYQIKEEAAKDGNKSMKQLAKLMLNALYGKFGLNPICARKEPYLKEDVVKYHTLPKEERSPIYVGVATFVTAYAREITIRSAQKVYNRFIYADTDSLHLIGQEIPSYLNVDKFELGAWDDESYFDWAKFLRQKCYIEQIKGKLKVTIAGLPENLHPLVTKENFELNAEYFGKLVPKHVKGGIVLTETTYKIRG